MFPALPEQIWIWNYQCVLFFKTRLFDFGLVLLSFRKTWFGLFRDVKFSKSGLALNWVWMFQWVLLPGKRLFKFGLDFCEFESNELFCSPISDRLKMKPRLCEVESVTMCYSLNRDCLKSEFRSCTFKHILCVLSKKQIVRIWSLFQVTSIILFPRRRWCNSGNSFVWFWT